MQELLQDQTAKAYLEKCSALYEALAKHILRLKRKSNPERVLEWVQMTAYFCWQAHPGRFADGRIENLAFELGEKLADILPRPPVIPRFSSTKPSHSSRRRVLHVATSVNNIGGHSRLINKWMDNDADSNHSLLLTNQETFPLPPWLSQIVKERDGEVTILPSQFSLLERAWNLREIARTKADSVVMHTHPNDVVPIVALACEQIPPVALMNHADHVFWLGPSVSDLIIDLRGYGQELSKTRRYAKRDLLLPLPLDLKKPSITRQEARRKLNLKESDIVLLSIGVAYKYIPTKTHNFYQTLQKLLEQNPSARFYQVGFKSDENKFLGNAVHERAQLLGRLDDPTLYQVAADLYLEGFPHGSLTALLETAALGVCPVLMYAPPMPNSDVAECLGGKASIRSTESESDYIAHVTSLINDAEERTRIGGQTREFIVSAHSKAIWKQHLEGIYQYLDSIKHQPARIPDSDFMATASDLGLSAFACAQYGNTSRLLNLANAHFDTLSRDDVTSLFYASLTSRDTGFSYAPMRHWLGMWKRKMFGSPRASQWCESDE